MKIGNTITPENNDNNSDANKTDERFQNQFTKPIKQIVLRFKALNWKPAFLIPSLIEFLALSMVLIVFVILWPYGLIPIIARFIWDLLKANVNDMKDKHFAEAMPNTVAIGIYFLIWLPFFIICLPIYTIGFIGSYFSGNYRSNNY